MKQIELVIFDCDGVLLDSEIISCQCAAMALQAVGLQIDIDTVFQRFVGTSRGDMAKQVAAEGYPVGPDFANKLEQSVVEAFEDRLCSIPGVDCALAKLHMLRCVASSSAVPYIRRGLQLTGLDHFFEPHLFSASMVSHGKPAPDLFLYAAQRMNVSPNRCLVIEDSIPGIRAALAAGMPAFRFTGGSHFDLDKRPQDFTGVHSVQTFNSMLELPELIDKFCLEIT
jgi:HAD superfamily hydrolase (TIGR01509 family)